MTRIRQQSEIVLSILDYLRSAQPQLDTKPGTVSRDLLVDNFAAQLAKLYEELQRVSSLQSLRLALGTDLDRLGYNYGVVRKQATKASGAGLLTFNELPADIIIKRGDIVTAKNGSQFIIQNNKVLSSVFLSTYKATASQYKASLDEIGITDQYAVEILLEASIAGEQGNISKYSLSSTSIVGINNVTNASPFGGGTSPEDDAALRSRIIASLGGANTGTALGYKSAATIDPSVLDAIVIEPGDTLMTRDGTVVYTDEEGNKTITSEGTGGKIDIYIYGTRIQEVLDSYIYADKSNTGSAANEANDYVLGQIAADANKTVTKKRIDDLSSGVLPNQPVNNIVQVIGSVSGANFKERTVDSLGRVSGNYYLVKDTGAYAGSPWGYDRLRWISNQIEDHPEDKTKGIFNGQDVLSFVDANEICKIEQRITITNENSTVNRTDRSIIQLSHYPCSSITRVFNQTTGERYVVSNQNLDGSGSINYTGRIKIQGSSLPSISDVLQVDYIWLFSYDPNWDYDDLIRSFNPRTVQDSIDWGYSNAVRREPCQVNSTSQITTDHPISAVISVNKVISTSATVNNNVNGVPGVQLTLGTQISNVVSINLVSDSTDLWNTALSDGSISGAVIYLPSDALQVADGSAVTVYYNAVDIYNLTNFQGSFSGSTITLATDGYDGYNVEVNYIANVSTLLQPVQLSTLPISMDTTDKNKFKTKTLTSIGFQPTTHNYSGSTIISNYRQAPSNIGLSVSGAISPGIFTVRGTTITGVFEGVMPVSSAGLTVDLSYLLRKALGYNSGQSLPTNIRIARVSSVEKVTTTTNFEVLSSDFTYDVKGYHIYDNKFVKDEAVQDTSISKFQFTLPSTSSNSANQLVLGDRIRITFYFMTTSDSENVSFGKSGTLYTNKRFALIDSISIASGFTSSTSGNATLTLLNLNQPNVGSRYRAYYNYIAPKQNERITIDYNINKLIKDVTLNVERTRPINADVLVKESTPVGVDVEMNVVVLPEYVNNSVTVQENVKDAITSALNANSLGTTIDSSDLVYTAQGIEGVDRVRVMYFNRADTIGSVLSITAEKNQYIQANEVTVNIEER